MKHKVLLYITRGRREVLVFEQPNPDAGVQVPGGTVEPGETPTEAAVREAIEETGLAYLTTPVLLGSRRALLTDDAGREFEAIRHFYWLEAQPGALDGWEHSVTAGDEDEGLRFRHRFAPVEEPGIDWGMDALLPELVERLA